MNGQAQELARPTVGQYLEDGGALLSRISDSPRLDAEVLMGIVLRKPRSFLHAWPERELSEPEAAAYEALIRRRFAGEPIAYISGVKEFWSMPLRVTPDVLIPRPDTELLVEKALERIPREGEDIAVLDLGTGSGAVALAIARERPDVQVVGVDISLAAVEIAQLNASIFKLGNVSFHESNWFDAVRGRKFHVVVTNPPYVEYHEGDLLAPQLRFEPTIALAAGPDGLDSIRAIIDRAHNYIVRQGWMLIEHGADQARGVRRLLEAQRYYDITCHKDLAGHDRLTECRFVE